MHSSLEKISFNRFIPVSVIYLFFNTAGMPEGLLWTTLLTPFFLYDNLRFKNHLPTLIFASITFLWFLWHYALGIQFNYYVRSWLMAFCNFQFCISAYLFFKKEDSIPSVFRTLAFVNVLFLIIAIAFRFIPSLQTVFWYLVPVSPGLPVYPRLKMLSSEASVYSLMITPLFLYGLFNAISSKNKNYLFLLCTLLLSFILSFSLGVLACLIVALSLAAMVHGKYFFSNKKFNTILFITLGICFLLLILFAVWQPDNLLFARIKNVLHGHDTSARGRTYESFILAWRMIKEKSIWFGIGLGQIKAYGRSIVLEYYRYTGIPQTIRIPNAAAEMLTYYGIVGLSLKLIIEAYLFVKYKVLKDPLRLTLFIFIFLYQFTGSYLTNIAEYIIWIMAFTVSVKKTTEPKADNV